MMSQWSTVRKDLEDEEERAARAEAEAFDPEAQERKRRRQIEEWKAEQLRSGQAEDNANFLVRRGRAGRPIHTPTLFGGRWRTTPTFW